ncbi:hypothetical protein PI124_g2005 [Phytophthora idaei]|nr:hypothetical protein PI125_g5461 [Phytophthora idaei]KAG3163711.1 hypothetical protein PI126_g5448 [Phytophthora idaei]KAG3253435.1 hypothetical protein PI124_g2005 [Phytophthora idaei]
MQLATRLTTNSYYTKPNDGGEAPTRGGAVSGNDFAYVSSKLHAPIRF